MILSARGLAHDPLATLGAEIARSLQAQAGKKPCVGLFDSGKGETWQARIVDVIPPTGDDDVPTLPAGEWDLVPGYYRDSPFSRAWMRSRFALHARSTSRRKSCGMVNAVMPARCTKLAVHEKLFTANVVSRSTTSLRATT